MLPFILFGEKRKLTEVNWTAFRGVGFQAQQCYKTMSRLANSYDALQSMFVT